MGVCGALPDAADRGRATTPARPASGLQCPALGRQDGSALALPAGRPAALDRGLPTDPTLARGRGLRANGARPAGHAALGGGSGGPAPRCHVRQRHGSTVPLAVDPLGHLRARHVTPANEQERAQVGRLAAAGQDVTGEMGSWPSSTTAIPDPSRRRRRPIRASRWRSSSWPRPSVASCACPGAGSWSAPSPGRRGAGVWPKTMNGCRMWSKGCISLPLCA